MLQALADRSSAADLSADMDSVSLLVRTYVRNLPRSHRDRIRHSDNRIRSCSIPRPNTPRTLANDFI